MERLTRQGELGPYWDKCVFSKHGGMEEDLIIDRLAHYEDLEEQGRVVAIAEWEDYSEIRDDTVCGRAEVKYKRCSNCKQPMGLSGDRHCGNCGAKMNLIHSEAEAALAASDLKGE